MMKSGLKKLTKKKNLLSEGINNQDQQDSTKKYQEKNKGKFNHLREHEFMLTDKTRVESYHDAISRFVHPGDTVIDLGTGTGILAFFAAQKGAKKVYAIEHADVISAAERVAKFNEINNIEFIKTHSQQFSIDAPVDVIIHEQMGNFLLDEYMVDNICDLRDRILKKGGRILPAKFELFIEPVKVVDSQHVPMIREMKIHGIDFSCLQENGAEELYSFLWWSDPTAIDYFLCDPQPIYTLNLETIKPSDIPVELNYSRVIKHAGRLDGFIVYFRCIFDDDLSLTTGPVRNRATSWKYWLLRVESAPYKEGDSLHLQLKADDLKIPTTWQWNIK
jgi:type I protein arginine methyltransferase